MRTKWGRIPTRGDVETNPPGIFEPSSRRRRPAPRSSPAENERWQKTFNELFKELDLTVPRPGSGFDSGCAARLGSGRASRDLRRSPGQPSSGRRRRFLPSTSSASSTRAFPARSPNFPPASSSIRMCWD